MTTVKNEIIQAFKDACLSGESALVEHRKMSVETQFQRNIWELDYRYGRIRIQNNGEACTIILFPFVRGYTIVKQADTHEITSTQFEELQNLYFGNFKPKHGYLESIYKTFGKAYRP